MIMLRNGRDHKPIETTTLREVLREYYRNSRCHGLCVSNKNGQNDCNPIGTTTYATKRARYSGKTHRHCSAGNCAATHRSFTPPRSMWCSLNMASKRERMEGLDVDRGGTSMKNPPVTNSMCLQKVSDWGHVFSFTSLSLRWCCLVRS